MKYKIALTGASGFVGQTIARDLARQGHAVIPLRRPQTKGEPSADAIVWDPAAKTIQSEKLAGLDAVVHLSGANIADQRWTPAYKETILQSRVDPTRFLAETIAGLKSKPKVFISASAVGYYGHHPAEEIITETTAGGTDFLANVCLQWERAASALAQTSVRVIHLRFGMVLGRSGALAKMLPIFKLGLGGVLGHGQQMVSWIAADEIPGIIAFLLERPDITGAVNAVAPNPVSNRAMTRVLGEILRRPVIFPVPAFGLKLLFGEMGDSLLLNGARVVPERLMKAGYHFRYPDMASTLRHVLNN